MIRGGYGMFYGSQLFNDVLVTLGHHANFGAPVYFVNQPNAGTITSAGDSRLIQFGARVAF